MLHEKSSPVGGGGMAAEKNKREPMSKVDTAWLRMESPTNLMMITGVLIFRDRLDVAKVRKLLAERWLAFRRFRQRAVDTVSAAYWETDPDLDMDWHVRLAALPGKADKRALEKWVSDMASTSLDHARPLWQFHVVDNYVLDDGQRGSVLLGRIHHCYADGLALVQVMLSLTDAAPKQKRQVELAKAWQPKDQGSVLERLLQPTFCLRAGNLT